VHHHRDAVGREAHVELDALGAAGERLPERLHGVLGRVRRVAAVPNDRSAVRIEKRMHADG